MSLNLYVDVDEYRGKKDLGKLALRICFCPYFLQENASSSILDSTVHVSDFFLLRILMRIYN